MSAIVVNEQRVLSLKIVINQSKVIKYFICGLAHWWVDNNNEKVQLPPEEFQEMKKAVKEYMLARRKIS